MRLDRETDKDIPEVKEIYKRTSVSSIRFRQKNKCYKLHLACISTSCELIFHKLSYTGKLQIMAIYIYVRCTKVITDY